MARRSRFHGIPRRSPSGLELWRLFFEKPLDDELGGKAHFKDIEIAVAQHLNLEAELVKIVRSGKRTEFAYRMSWARTACKGKGLIRNLGKGIWEKT